MFFFLGNHLARIFLEKDGTLADQIKQLLIEREPGLFGVERFKQNVIDAVFLGLQQRPNLQRRMFAEMGDHFARLVRVLQTCCCFTT